MIRNLCIAYRTGTILLGLILIRLEKRIQIHTHCNMTTNVMFLFGVNYHCFNQIIHLLKMISQTDSSYNYPEK